MAHQSLLQSTHEFIATHWQRYCERARALSELACLHPDEIDALAADCGLSPGQFRSVVGRGPHAADELNELMAALGIDAEKLQSRDRTPLNDMKLICSECGRKAICRKSLRKGTIASDHPAFCNNAELLAEVRENFQPMPG
jgi:hypothetical protein